MQEYNLEVYHARRNIQSAYQLLDENIYKYRLQDVEEGNYFRSMFEYTTVPKVAFNNRVVPMCMPEEIWVTDTTFRDGQQSRSPFTVKQIVDLYKLMSKLGGPKGLIRQSEFFPYTDADRAAIEQCMGLGSSSRRSPPGSGRRNRTLPHQGHGHEGDRHIGFLFGLSHFP